MIHPTPRLRFAPSPTGPLHLGGARTAMYNWALCKSLGGAFVLRIEDTDRQRSTDASLQVILAGLDWLGIDWDEGPEYAGTELVDDGQESSEGPGAHGGGDYGPYFQMQRLSRYAAAAERLLASGHAYRCYCSPERIAEVREKQKAAKSSFLGYDGHCRDLSEEQCAAYEAKGIEPNLRFRMPESQIVRCHDLIRGEVEVDAKQLDDWVMVRPSPGDGEQGVPLYNFACVVDDIDMKITHVVRGEEHFLNGTKQRLLFEALGHECPQYAHIPLILNQKGGKLSKRDPGVMSVLEYRDLGYPPEAVFNYIALLGWGFSADRDVFSRAEMVEVFKIGSVGKAGAKFDLDKLHWMCGEYVRQWPLAKCFARSRQWLDAAFGRDAIDAHPGYYRNAVGCFQERVQLLSEFPAKLSWLHDEPAMDEGATKALAKHAERKPLLHAYADLLEGLGLPPSAPADRQGIDDAVALPTPEDAAAAAAAGGAELPFATPAAVEAATRAFLEEHGAKFGQLVQPTRALLTGTTKGPSFFDIVWLLGAETCARRLRAFDPA
ncbi:MAG: glutamate--tRNA ligase [Planctomycetota bacterium]